ncbi:tetratricopeptide repeat protein [Streptomyces sp. NPDC002851]
MEWGIRILGPVELRIDGRGDRLGSAKERLTLAALALDAGRPVPLDALIQRLWDDEPPAKPRSSLHVYAARLRKRLRAAGLDRHLIQQAHTYTLDLPPGHVDWHRFQELGDRARARVDADDDSGAHELLTAAEQLWRGEPLAGLTGLWADRTRSTLAEKHLAARITRLSIELRRGHFAEAAPDIAALLEQHPYDETLAGLLIVADYGRGRQAEALRLYETVRRRLRADLGTEPGQALSRLHRLILKGAPVRELLTPTSPTPKAPRTLPSHAELVGREAELDALLRAAAPRSAVATAAPTGTVIALQAISGMAGVGKSLLALHAARRLAEHYPDGQIHLDLRAHSPGQEPLPPKAALAALLRMLGVTAAALPQHRDELITLWRTLLSTRRVVIVLDDVADAEQLRPLLPGSSPSVMIVTSRRRLTGLPGVRPLFLDTLPRQDAVALFRSLAGQERTRSVGEVTEIVRLSGQLPLAIELAAERLVSRPSWTTAHLLRRLSQGDGRLAEIRDGSREMARAFEVSYQALSPAERSVFRLLGLRLGPDVDLCAAAALADLPLDRTERIIEVLLDAHLIREPSPERYAFHDLLGEYSRSLVIAEDPPEARDLAVRRLIDFYVEASAAADRTAYPRRPRPALTRPRSTARIPSWTGPEAAKQWLSAERTGLIAAARRCHAEDLPREAALLADAVAGFLNEEGYSAEAQHLSEFAVHHWSSTGDRQAEIHARLDLATALSRRSRYEQALSTAGRALDAARELADPRAEAEALHLLGVLNWHTGRLTDALAHQNRAYALRVRAGDRLQIARAQNNLGIFHLFLGNHEESDRRFNAALSGFRALGDSHEEARVLNNLSDLHQQQGDRKTSRDFLNRALEILRDTGNASERAITQVNLADTMTSPDELDTMLDLYRDSLATFRRIGDLRNAAITLHGMGGALCAAGRYGPAAEHHRRALELARGIGAATEESQALHGLGEAERRAGEHAAAARHLTGALRIADRIGAAAQATAVRASLAELEGAKKPY